MAEWVIDSLVGFLKSPFWSYPLSSFIDHHCTVFDPGDENKFAYTDIHKEYQTMVENLLESFMSDLGITSDQFSDVCSQESAFGQEHEHLFEQILAADNFLIFKSMMVQKNIELELRALALLQRQLGHSPRAYSGDPEEEFLQGKGASREDDAVLEEALKQSQKEYDLRQSLDEEEMERLLEMAKAESLRLYQAQQREQEELAGQLERVLQTPAPISISDSGSSKELENAGLQNETVPSSSEMLTKPEQGTEELSTSPPCAAGEHAGTSTVAVRKELVERSPENLTPEINQGKPGGQQPQGASSATRDALPKGSNRPGTFQSKSSDHQRSKEEPLKSRSPGSPSSLGSGVQIKKELSGAEAAARWIESAKTDVQRGVTGGSIRHGVQVSPDDLKAREAYLRRQRDRLLEMKKKERAKQFDSFAASQSFSQSTLAKVARSAAEGELKEGRSKEGGKGRASVSSDRRGKNTGILCSTIAGKLKELAQEDDA